jgi:lysozyme
MSILPAARPKLDRAGLLARLAAAGIAIDADRELFVAGIRGYYEDSMGAPGRNDRGLYDDAIFLVGPGLFKAYNGNTDPSRVRKGRGTGAAKGMAVLRPGLYRCHRFDVHRRGTAGAHEALCQRAGIVTVTRDGVTGDYVHAGSFGINIHRGGATRTNSEGCQTVPPAQWGEFIAAATAAAKRLHGARWRSAIVPYALIEA